MAKKLKLTRPELKRQRDALERFERYLPMLKLKQQQLQVTIRDVNRKRRDAEREAKLAREKFERYDAILADRAGLDIPKLAEPKEVRVTRRNIAGVNVPVYEGAEFPRPTYSLFATPPWVDAALADLQDLNGRQARLDVLREQYELLNAELTKIIQRVNLFEKVKIPDARENIRRIRIHLGDEMTAAVGRAKIAKTKLEMVESAAGGKDADAGFEEASA